MYRGSRETLELSDNMNGHVRRRQCPDTKGTHQGWSPTIVLREVCMTVQKELRIRDTDILFMLGLLAALAAFPQSAYAVEAGCFCTFVFVSTMFVIGIAVTLIVKHVLSKKMWKLSMKRTSLITFLEVILMMSVLFILQTRFYFRLLVYIPMAFLLNYALIAAKASVIQETRTSKKRVTMAMLSCLVLPVAVQIMGWLGMVLSNMITFKELRV
jgi:hypothetical protein